MPFFWHSVLVSEHDFYPRSDHVADQPSGLAIVVVAAVAVAHFRNQLEQVLQVFDKAYPVHHDHDLGHDHVRVP